MVVLFLAVLLMGYLGYRAMTGFVDQYTDSDPVELPPLEVTEVQKEQMQLRLKAFADGLREGKTTVPLVLRGDDLNVLLASSQDLQSLAERMRVRVEGNQVTGQVSMKLGDLGSPFFKDRYINGTASFRVSLQSSNLMVSPTDIRVNGKPLPDKYLTAMQSQNLAQSFNQDPELRSALEKLDTIEVEEGALKVVPKAVEE